MLGRLLVVMTISMEMAALKVGQVDILKSVSFFYLMRAMACSDVFETEKSLVM